MNYQWPSSHVFTHLFLLGARIGVETTFLLFVTCISKEESNGEVLI